MKELLFTTVICFRQRVVVVRFNRVKCRANDRSSCRVVKALHVYKKPNNNYNILK